MNFNFDITANASQSNNKPQLQPNKIHDVTFDGVEIRDVKDGQYKLLEIKFSNNEGQFVHTVWEPKEQDNERRPNAWGGTNPSNIETMLLLFKHLIDAVNPELGKKIDAAEVKLPMANWEQCRQTMVKATDPGKGKHVQIKLMKNNKGEAMFPFFSTVNRAGIACISSNFIGEHVGFLTKELERIKKAEAAAPTAVKANDAFTIPTTAQPETNDLSFDF